AIACGNLQCHCSSWKSLSIRCFLALSFHSLFMSLACWQSRPLALGSTIRIGSVSCGCPSSLRMAALSSVRSRSAVFSSSCRLRLP
ncbi:unnamed protein product, partial [Aphanomyces euteiches]